MDLVASAVQVHELLNLVVGGGAAAVLLLTVPMVLGVERARFAIDWIILGVATFAGAGSIAGLVVLAGSGGPRDVLHLAYAVLVLVALPVARVLGARSGTERESTIAPGPCAAIRLRHARLAAWLIGGAVTTLAAQLRLAATG